VDTPRWRGWWRWFAGGFAVAFVGLLLFYPVIAMHPSGQSAVRQRLWAFYADALPRAFGPSTLGPASSNSGMLAGVAFEHVALSTVGGCVAAGIGWWRRPRVPGAAEPNPPTDGGA
jgi:hypothetical protein